MIEQKTLSNHPVDPEIHKKARRLQRKLWACAKQSKTRKFHALYDRIHSWPILMEAYWRVRSNHGASGVDGQTIEEVEAGGVEVFLKGIQQDLQEGSYKPLAVRRVYIPKPDGKQRPLGIPILRDRVVQMSANIVLNPIFEADFKGCSFGFRPKRNPLMALERVRQYANRGFNYVLDADIQDYFNSIDHPLLIELVKRRICDRRVIKLIWQWLRSGVMEEGTYQETTVGAPQGAVISPLLSNIVLHELDREWESQYATYGHLTRFADDFIIQSVSQKQVEAVKRIVQNIMDKLKLKLHPQKTRVVNLSWGKEGFDFLGHTLKKTASYRFAGKFFLNRWPSGKSMNRMRQKIREVITRKRFGIKDVRELIPEINPILRGWGNYFKWGNANKAFNQMDGYVHYRLALFENRRRNRKRPHWLREFTHEWYRSLGFYQLMGTVRYPNPSLVLVKANA